MTVPAIMAEANSTPITTEDRSFQLLRLLLATSGQALINFVIN